MRARRARVALAGALLAGLGCAGGRRGPAGIPIGAASDCHALAYRPEELGFSLATATGRVPRHPSGIAAFLTQTAGPVAVRLDPVGGSIDERTFDYRSIAGSSACTLPDDRLRISAEPPTVTLLRPVPIAKERLARGRARLLAGEMPEARAEFQAALALDPDWAEPRAWIGDAYAAEERWAEAAAAYAQMTAAEPWRASARAQLGVARLHLGEPGEAVKQLRLALVLRPDSHELRRLVEDGMGNVDVRRPVMPPAERQTHASGVRWTVRLTAGGEHADQLAEGMAYATCKESFRTSEALRLAATGISGPRWIWSVAEEDLCTVMWLAAYARNRATGKRDADPRLESLAEVVAAGLLAERSLYDVGGRAHSYAVAMLASARRDRMVDFAARYRVVERLGDGWLGP